MGTNRELSKDVTMHTSSSLGIGTIAGVSGFSSIGLQLSGTWTGEVKFEATIDGENWEKFRCFNTATGKYATEARENSGLTTGVSMWVSSCSGLSGVRTDVSGVSIGGVTVIARITTAPIGELPTELGVLAVDIGASRTGILVESLDEQILQELKSMNTYLSALADFEID